MADIAPDGIATAATNRGGQRPGDNPNKRNAKERKNYRPKRVDVPRNTDARPTGFTIADPAPPVSFQHGEIAQVQEEQYIGYVTLDFACIRRIVDPFVQTASGMANAYATPDILVGARALHVATPLAIAKQLYETLDAGSQMALSTLRSISSLRLQIPTTLSVVLAIFGNVETRLGNVGVNNPITTFMRLIAYAYLIDQDIDDVPAVAARVPTLFFDTADLAAVMSPPLQSYVNAFYETIRTVNVAGEDIQVYPRHRGPGEASQPYSDYLDILGVPADIRDVVLRATFILDQGVTYALLTHQDSAPLLVAIGYEPFDIRPDVLRDFVSEFSRRYTATYQTMLVRIFLLTETSSSSKGKLASLVQASHHNSDLNARSKVPLSDSDAYLGFMVQPAAEVSFNPLYHLIARQTSRQESLADLSQSAHKESRP